MEGGTSDNSLHCTEPLDVRALLSTK